MALTRGFIRNAVTTPLDARLMDMAQIVGNTDGSPRTGVIDGDGRNIVTALATMNLAVAAAEFVTSKGAADGVVIFTNDGTVNVAITAAPASNSRIDVIWVKHNDSTTGDANSTPIFGVTAGTAAASPAKPVIPTGSLELATLRVYAGTTAANGGANTLTNTYAMTVSRGGIVPFRTLADLQAWTNPILGQVAAVLSNASAPGAEGLYKWNGTTWINTARGVATWTWAAGGVGDSGVVGPTVPLTTLAAETSGNDFVTATSGLGATVKAGLYVVTLHVAVNATVTGRTFAQLAKAGNTLSRNSAQTGEDTLSTTAVVYVESDGTVIAGAFYKTSGGSANMTGRFTIAKIG